MKLISLFLLLNLYIFQASAYEVSQDRRYIYIKRNLSDLRSDDATRMMVEHVQLFRNKLKKMFKSKKVTWEILKKLDLSFNELSELIQQLEEHGQSVAQNRGLRFRDMIPTGLMIIGGGKFSGNAKLGAGISASIGFVFVPKKVTRVDKITKSKSIYYESDWALVGIPVVNLGLGLGLGPRGRVGLALIWGDFKKANEFHGASLGVSASAAIGPYGANFKAGMVNWTGRLTNPFKFFFVQAQYVAGPVATAEIHGAASYIANAATVMSWFGLSNNSAEGTVISTPK